MRRPARRRVNGDGSLTKRSDGRWMGRYYAWTSAGTRKRITIYGKTRQDAADKMREAQERNRQGIPVPDRAWKLGDWLDYWLEHVVAANRRPATQALYEVTVRLYLKPALGRYPLSRLSASRVQTFLTGQLAAGHSIRKVQVMRTVLSSALARAMREELVMRNVAHLAELPTWERKPVSRRPRLRPARSWTPPGMTRCIRRSCSCCCTGCAAVRCWACAGVTWMRTTASCGSASTSSASTVSSGSARSRPPPDAATCPCSSRPPRSWSSAAPSRPLTAWRWAPRGRTPASSSVPNRKTHRAAQSRPVIPPDLRRARAAGHHRAPSAAHHRDPAEEPEGSGP